MNLQAWTLLALPLATWGTLEVTSTGGEESRPVPTLVANDATALERALDSVDADLILGDLEFLASDEMAGRDTPSDEQRVAARYLRSRLQRMGWHPGAPGGYLYSYWLDYNVLDAEASKLTVAQGEAESSFAFGSDYWFSSRGVTSQVFEGSVVAVGAGEDEDFEKVDVAGKWVLVHESEDRSGRSLGRRAEESEALGVIVTPAADYAGDAYPERFARWASQATRSRVQWPQNSKGKRVVQPFVYVSSAVAEALVGGLGAPESGTALGARVIDTRATQGHGGQVELEDVAGFWPGSDPELRDEVIIVSAHYDHVGVRADGEVYNGADDNGSGTSGLLAVADALTEYGPMRRSVLLLWVSGEEKGLLGAKAWATYPWLPAGYRPICDINIDMIGRNAPDYLLVTPTAEHEEYNALTQMAEAATPLEGFAPLGSADQYWHRSDHAMFAQNLGLPVAFLFSDVHEDYHKVTDTVEKIDTDKIRRVVRSVIRMLDGLQADVLEMRAAPESMWNTGRARGDVLRMGKACEAFARAKGAAPGSLAELLGEDERGKPWLAGGDVPADPWGRAYRYTVEGETFELISLGRDGEAGGEGEDADAGFVGR